MFRELQGGFDVAVVVVAVVAAEPFVMKRARTKEDIGKKGQQQEGDVKPPHLHLVLLPLSVQEGALVLGASSWQETNNDIRTIVAGSFALLYDWQR